MMPTLEECSKTPPRVSGPNRLLSCSEMTVFATRIVPSPVSMISCVFTTESSSAIAPGHDLEGRAGLVGVRDRAVAAQLRRVPVVLVRIEARGAGHREDLAVPRVHQDEHPGGGAVGRDGRGELLLRGELQRGVQRQRQAGPFPRRTARWALGLSVAGTAGVLEGHDLARLAADRLVVQVLQPSEPAVVGADVAEHRTRRACPSGRSAWSRPRAGSPEGAAPGSFRRSPGPACGRDGQSPAAAASAAQAPARTRPSGARSSARSRRRRGSPRGWRKR